MRIPHSNCERRLCRCAYLHASFEMKLCGCAYLMVALKGVCVWVRIPHASYERSVRVGAHTSW